MTELELLKQELKRIKYIKVTQDIYNKLGELNYTDIEENIIKQEIMCRLYEINNEVLEKRLKK